MSGNLADELEITLQEICPWALYDWASFGTLPIPRTTPAADFLSLEEDDDD